ncbi:MAG: glycerophosphodiester phosphodiesterase family protein [Acetanaerobacterium sp.]
MTFFIIAAAVVVALSYILLIAPADFPTDADERLWHCSYAHRGLHTRDKSIPENSMPAFAKAVQQGFGIELDINLTTDDRIVVFHDDNLQRVCGVDRMIADCTYEELCGYTLHDTGERIPLFEDVLALVDGRTPLIVELKATRRNDELCLCAARMLDAYKGAYCIESFHPAIVRWFCRQRPDVIRGQLSAGHKGFTGMPLWQSAALSLLFTNAVTRPHFVAYRHQDAHNKLRLDLFRLLGGKLVGWTVRDTDDIAYCQRRFDVIIFEYYTP